MLRVVADSNVYISAFNFGGSTSKVLELAQGGQITLFVSGPILEELERVFIRKFYWPEKQVHLAISNILEFAHLIFPTGSVDRISEDPADNRILECGLEARANCIVTGDKHLLRLGEFEDIEIVSPSQFLQSNVFEIS